MADQVPRPPQPGPCPGPDWQLGPPPGSVWQAPRPGSYVPPVVRPADPVLPRWVVTIRSAEPKPAPPSVLGAVLLTGMVASLVPAWSLGLNVLVVAVFAAAAAWLAARAAGRRPRPWTLVWAVGGVALLAVPALRDAGWPDALAILGALMLGALALGGGRGWHAVLLGWYGLVDSLGQGIGWYGRGLRALPTGDRARWWPVLRAVGVSVGLLVVFGALFAGADAEFGHLVGALVPSVSLGGSPVSLVYFVGAALLALAAARTAAAPQHWDRLKIRPGRERGRLEWALPLAVLDLLFAAFIAVQLKVLFGGYAAVLRSTGQTYAEYARQGFWQLLVVILLTLVVIALALRWAPRSSSRDRLLVRCLLGTLCGLALSVVVAALCRMDMYVGAYGLTRLRLSVAGTELWLGVVLVLLMAVGLLHDGRRWFPRAVVASAAVAVLAFGLVNPDAVIAQQSVARFQHTGKIDISYLQGLSADAVPALEKLPEPQRSCALQTLATELEGDDRPWYATSLDRAQAVAQLRRDSRPVDTSGSACSELGISPEVPGYVG